MSIGINDSLQIRLVIMDYVIHALKFGGSITIRTNPIPLPLPYPQTFVQIGESNEPVRVSLDITARELFEQIERIISRMDLQKLMFIGKTKLSISIEEAADGQTIIIIATNQTGNQALTP